MADKTAPPEQSQQDNKNAIDEGQTDPRQDIFDARFMRLTDEFGKTCEQEGVAIAIAIAIHPEEKEPIIFIRGHEYDVAVTIAGILRQLTRGLLAPLNPDPSYEPTE